MAKHSFCKEQKLDEDRAEAQGAHTAGELGAGIGTAASNKPGFEAPTNTAYFFSKGFPVGNVAIHPFNYMKLCQLSTLI